jgi:hypothetical protein
VRRRQLRRAAWGQAASATTDLGGSTTAMITAAYEDPILNVYAELYRLLGVEPPDAAGRTKPPCCDVNDRPTRGTVAGRAYLDLRNLARRTRRPTNELHQIYASKSDAASVRYLGLPQCQRHPH